jgi:hypothetical protein
MQESLNVWGIREYEGDGVSCPIVPANLPWQKKLVLTFFRFGICPMCVTSSLLFSAGKFFGGLYRKSSQKKQTEKIEEAAFA